MDLCERKQLCQNKGKIPWLKRKFKIIPKIEVKVVKMVKAKGRPITPEIYTEIVIHVWLCNLK